jgi:hypothetical protein
MVSHNHIVRLLSVVVRSLRKEFPEDLPTPQPMIFAKEEPHDDHRHYRL